MTIHTRMPARAQAKPRRRLRSRVALGTAVAVGLQAFLLPLGALSASAAPATFTDVATGAAITFDSTTVELGGTILLDGTGWTTQAGDSGSHIAIKIDRGGIQPVGVTDGVWQVIEADADGTFDDVEFAVPDGTTSGAQGSATAVAPGTYSVHFLTGSLIDGDKIRSVAASITLTDPAAQPEQPALEASFAVTPGVVTPGEAFAVSGEGLETGQQVQVFAGDTALNDAAAVVAEGATTVSVSGLVLPEDTAFGSVALRVVVSDAEGAGLGAKDLSVQYQHKVSFAFDPARVAAGEDVKVTLSGLAAGAVLSRVAVGDASVANVTADTDGVATATIAVPADVAIGTAAVSATQTAPYAATFDAATTVDRAFFGADAFDIDVTSIRSGLYQTAYGAASDAVFLTASVGRPPILDSELVKVDPETLEVLARVTPAAVDASDASKGVYGVYGVGTDDENGTVWVTNTRQNTVAVYSQEDLSLITQFEAGIVSHSRDVIVDETRDRAYVSAARSTSIAVFDTTTYEQLESIELTESVGVSPMSLALDEEAGTLVTVSLDSPRAAIIDVSDPSDPKVRGIDLENAVTASGAGYDPATKRLFVASQGSNNLLIVDTVTGEVLHDVATGGGALNAVFNEVDGLVYVSNRTGGSVTVVTVDGELVANLNTGGNTNHASVAADGSVYVVNKGGGATAGLEGDLLTRIRFVEEPGTEEPGTEEPGTEEPGTEEPGTEEPGTEEPGTEEPGTEEPGTEEPGTEEPGTEEPGTELPSTGGSIDTVPSEADLTTATKGGISGPTSVEQGQAITLLVGAQRAGQQVHGWIFSTPTSLGIRTVATGGAIQVTIPADLAAGTHRIAVTDADGAVIGWYSVSVTAAGTLAVTGSDFNAAAGTVIALILLLSGAGVYLVSARRRAHQQ